MSVDVSKLKREKVLENEKIKISFSIGTVNEQLIKLKEKQEDSL